MKRLQRSFFLTAGFIVIISLLLSTAGCGGKGTKTTNITPTSYVDTRGRTGNIITGDKIEAATETIPATGGAIEISTPGDPLDGFVLDVPAGAYPSSNNFKVSYAPITSQTFGADINPVSPMIYVDNGDAYSNELMYVRVPVTVPAGYFAMGFYYDEQTKQLEGMPLVGADSESVTVATRHFSNFIISAIEKTLLGDDIDSGFRPGTDDWQFTNYGSYVAVGGHCEGQSMSALWYYCTKPDGNTNLYGTYDNNGEDPATPSFWQDDSLGYRFASMVQDDINGDSAANTFWLNMGGKNWVLENNKWKMVDVPGIGDEATYDMFAYAMQATGEPQLVIIWSSGGGGHAMIVYRISGGSMYIADPNYPGNTGRRIEYAGGKLSPYNSGANMTEIEAGNGHAYETIQYYAKSTVISWDKIGERWTDLLYGTIGNDKFPSYELQYVNEDGQKVALPADLKTPFDAISISVHSLSGKQLGVQVYRSGEMQQYDAKGNFDLQPGENKLGVYVVGKVNGSWEYVDFQYVNVNYEEETTTTTTAEKGEHPVIESFTGPTSMSEFIPGGTVTYSITISGGTAPYRENWSANTVTIFEGENMETVQIPVEQVRWNGESYSIYLQVQDANGEAATWMDSVGMGHAEFMYDVWGDVVRMEPTFPYRSYGQ